MYKQLLSTILWAILFFAPTLAPAQFSIQKADLEHEDAMRPTLQMQLEPSADEVKEAWQDFIKDRYDVKLKGIGFLANKDLMTAEEVTFEALSDKKMNFYTRAVEKDGMTQMNVFASFGYDIYLNPADNPVAWRTLQSITQDFLKTFLPKYYEEDIAAVQETISDLRDEQNDMQEEMKENREEIEKLTKRNEELSKNLNENEAATTEAANRLSKKESTYEQVKKQLERLNGVQ